MNQRTDALKDIPWKEVFAFTRIFRAFRVAIRPSKMLLAMVALVLMYIGGTLLDSVWPRGAVREGYGRLTGMSTFAEVAPPFQRFLTDQIGSFNRITTEVVDWNWGYPSGVPGAVAEFMVLNPVAYWRANALFFSILFAWFLVVWAIFGGAICRIAAVHAARDEVVSPLRAMRFSLKAFPSFVAAPLIPLLVILLLGAIVGVMGLLLYIPAVGPILTGIILFVAIALGLLMTVIAVGAVAGSGLMYPTIATEGSDAFDAISRALSHVFSAPWRLLFYTAVAIVYGAMTYFFVRICVYILLAMVHYFVGWFAFGDTHEMWMHIWPGPNDVAQLLHTPRWQHLSGWESVAAAIVALWVYLVIATVGAYVISFYFSASTIIYLLMRRKVDATEMDVVYIDPEDQATEPPTIAPATPAAPAAGAENSSNAS